MKEIVVVSADWKFRVLVRAELRERGYAARGYDSLATAIAELNPQDRLPAVLVLDAAETDATTTAQHLATWARHVPVVLVLTAAEAAFQPPPNVSVLRRPVRVEDVVARTVECAGVVD